MSGGGGIFGALATLDKKVQETINPVQKYIDPIGAAIHKKVANDSIKLFAPKPQQAPGASPSAAQDNAASSMARASTGAVGGGTGAGAKDLVTAPPDTPEGDRMRLNRGMALAGGANTLLGN